MKENYPKVDTSEIYKILELLSKKISPELFEGGEIDDDIDSSSDFVRENIENMNSEIVKLSRNLENKDAVKSSLFQLRIYIMNVASEFDNLRESMDELINKV